MFRLEKSLLGFEIVLDIIDDDEDVDNVCLLVVNGVVSSVVLFVMVGFNVRRIILWFFRYCYIIDVMVG